MAQQDWIGAGILIVSLALFAVLMKVRFIRRNPLLVMVFSVNPGLVGVLAACAFWFRNQGLLAIVFWVGTMLVTVGSTLTIMLVVPRAYFEKMKADIEDEASRQRPDDQGDAQG
jgi:predicted membrane channel-forming protein YqfA (hemolysin III family)